MRDHIVRGVLLAGLSALSVASFAAEQSIQPIGIIGQPAGTGKWPAVAESREDLRAHTIYRPQQMPDAPLPVLWRS